MSDQPTIDKVLHILDLVYEQRMTLPDSLSIIIRLMDKREIEGKRSTANFANDALFNLLPTGDVNSWDMLKAVQSWQNIMEKYITELEQQLKTLNSNEESGE